MVDKVAEQTEVLKVNVKPRVDQGVVKEIGLVNYPGGTEIIINLSIDIISCLPYPQIYNLIY